MTFFGRGDGDDGDEDTESMATSLNALQKRRIHCIMVSCCWLANVMMDEMW
jgi:hypothetical protein